MACVLGGVDGVGGVVIVNGGVVVCGGMVFCGVGAIWGMVVIVDGCGFWLARNVGMGGEHDGDLVHYGGGFVMRCAVWWVGGGVELGMGVWVGWVLLEWGTNEWYVWMGVVIWVGLVQVWPGGGALRIQGRQPVWFFREEWGLGCRCRCCCLRQPVINKQDHQAETSKRIMGCGGLCGCITSKRTMGCGGWGWVWRLCCSTVCWPWVWFAWNHHADPKCLVRVGSPR